MEKPIRKVRRTAQFLQFPRLYLVTKADLDLQKQAEQILRALNGRCPVCRSDEDGHGWGDGAISIQARWGRLTFECRACRVGHERIAAKLVKRKLIDKPKREPKSRNWRERRGEN